MDQVIQIIITSLLGMSKDSILYLLMGMTSGAIGTIIRISRSPTFGPNAAIWKIPFRWLGMIFTWTLAGGLFALTIGLNPIVSVICGLFAPTLYDILEYNTPRFILSKLNNSQFKEPPPHVGGPKNP